MTIGIYYNIQQVEEEIARHLSRALESAGARACICASEEEISGVDRLIVLGGDGTVLHAARWCSQYNIPLVGVNFGRLGFLTEFERGDMEKTIALVLDTECNILRRSMLEVDLNGTSTHCLNELALLHAVTEADGTRVSRISVTIDGSQAGEFTADGLIVSTPTGSTAYSLSAGGSIMTPDCPTFLLTPVCAFSLKSRPIAYSDESELSFSVSTMSQPLMLYGDGIFLGKVGAGDVISVRKSKRYASFMTAEKGGFFRRLTEKLN